MKNQKGLSFREVLVVIVVIVILFALYLPTLGKVKTLPQKLVCGTNLKVLGTAITVYANEYNDTFPQLSGMGSWSKELGFDFDLEKPDFGNAQSKTPRTITASLYLLIREMDVSPKVFVCPASNEWEFDGQNSNNLDIIELWDFGSEPHNHVSYVYHNPYGRFSANKSRSSSFAVMADMSPWFFKGNIVKTGENPQIWEDGLPKETNLKPPQIMDIDKASLWKLGNTPHHFKNDSSLYTLFNKRYKFGQNVLYADGHSEFVNYSNVGIDKDNIYTFWSMEESPTEQDKQGGTAPTSRSPENDAKSKEDSFLAI